ncbi:terminase large subunit [Caudoviricetes sp.]|nr:terminase large subunit [Caudoviricetes sp.]
MAQIIVKRSELDVVIAVDPAISEKQDAARSAVVCAGISPYNKMFLLEIWAARQGDPHKLIMEVLSMANRWQPRTIGIETIAYQKALKPFMERQMLSLNMWYPITELKPDRNEKKNQRILSMQPFFRSGQVYIQRGMFPFIDEYEAFPNGRTVDILDACAYALRLLVPQAAGHAASIEAKIQALAKNDPMSARYWRADAVKRGLIERQPTLEEEMDAFEEDIQPGIGEFV